MNKDLAKLESQLREVLKNNAGEEKALRDRNIGRKQEMVNNVMAYDHEINTAEESKSKMKNDYDDSVNDLKMMQDEYELLREEAEKRERIAAIIAKKEAAFFKKQEQIN